MEPPITPAATPEAPAAPATPVLETPAAEPAVPTQPEAPAQQEAEDKEWDEVAADLFPGLEKPTEKEGEPESPTDPNAPAKPEESDEKKEGEEQPEAPVQPTDDPALEMRMAQRASEEDANAIRSDLRATLFKDAPLELRDKDGDPIRSVADVMKLIDPRTGDAFTEEAAAVALVEMKQNLQTEQSRVNQYIEAITAENVRIKDEASMVLKKYDSVFKANPEIGKQLMSEWRKTLVMEMATNAKGERVPVILKAPVSPLAFFSAALEPHLKLSEVQAQADQAKQEAAKVTQKQQRSDRADIYASGPPDNRGEDDKEWDAAAQAVFGNQLK